MYDEGLILLTFEPARKMMRERCARASLISAAPSPTPTKSTMGSVAAEAEAIVPSAGTSRRQQYSYPAPIVPAPVAAQILDAQPENPLQSQPRATIEVLTFVATPRARAQSTLHGFVSFGTASGGHGVAVALPLLGALYIVASVLATTSARAPAARAIAIFCENVQFPRSAMSAKSLPPAGGAATAVHACAGTDSTTRSVQRASKSGGAGTTASGVTLDAEYALMTLAHVAPISPVRARVTGTPPSATAYESRT